MILDFFSSGGYIIHVLKLFKNFVLKANLQLEIQNVYNESLLEDIKKTLEKERKVKLKNLLVIKFSDFSYLKPIELRSGPKGYVDTNEYYLSFTLFFMSMELEEKTSAKNSLKMYELFNEFLYKSRFSFSEDREEDSEAKISIFINQINESKLPYSKKN